jgi:hypothetical protein
MPYVCPLRFDNTNSKCIEEDCAWFDDSTSLCVVYTIGKAMKEIKYTLKKID